MQLTSAIAIVQSEAYAHLAESGEPSLTGYMVTSHRSRGTTSAVSIPAATRCAHIPVALSMFLGSHGRDGAYGDGAVVASFPETLLAVRHADLLILSLRLHDLACRCAGRRIVQEQGAGERVCFPYSSSGACCAARRRPGNRRQTPLTARPGQ